MERAMSRSSLAERIYRALLRLYPREFRERFATDMAELFRDQRRGLEGPRARLGHWGRVLEGLGRTAPAEHLDQWRRRREHPRSNRRRFEMRHLIDDVRYGARMLRKSPVFAAVAVLVITVGTGAVTTIFSAANAIALRPIPGARDPDRLVALRRALPDGSGSLSASYPYYRRLRSSSRTMAGLVAWDLVRLTIATDAGGRTAVGNLVSANYFVVLGVRPVVGRFFGPDEGPAAERDPVAVLSHGFWVRQLGADSSAIGRPIRVNGHPFTIVGVAPPGFRGVFSPVMTDLWVPMVTQPLVRGGELLDDVRSGWLEIFGRLKPGVDRAAAQAELAAITRAHAAEAGEGGEFVMFTGARLESLTGLPGNVYGSVVGFMALLLGAAGLVLLIASVNVAAMLLARGVARRRELALRAALGAERRRLATQLLTETLLVFAAGGVGGVLLATGATRLLEHLPLPGDLPIVLELSPDLRVLGFALAVSLVTGVAFGLGPALDASRIDLTARIGSGSPGGAARRSRARNALVVGQMALSLLLLVAAGLFIRALQRGRSVDPGFDAANVAVASFDLQSAGYDEPRGRIFYRALAERLRAEPGVAVVAYTRFLPLSMSVMASGFRIEGAAGSSPGSEVPVPVAAVDPGYFGAVRMPLLEGRGFQSTDDERAAGVAVVNETFARRYAGGKSPIGLTFHEGDRPITVVGLVRDAKYETLNEAPTPFLYLPLAQRWSADANLMVRTSGDAPALAKTVRAAVRALDPGLPPPAVGTLKDATSIVLLPQRIAAWVTGWLGLVGLTLAALGLYGIIAYSVGQRTREIGVRMALGADRRDVLRLVVREGLSLVAAGMAIGLVLALAATRLLGRFLFGVSPIDAATFVAVAGLLTVVAGVASYLPARRAAQQDPTVTLRYDG
jgi:predicted permease